ncbi:MAG: DNA mismatch repair endonuclease MutL [Firmicutes bacterium]|nr:DNA mismatch repair endonuclease MutL [Bacillota bacterium]
MRILKLAPEVADRIAAGEVVERPASVMKELVENSIDAGASAVRIEIAGGGLELISVSDDGCGMSREDACLAFERHATSKISRAEDLFSIVTLGFRGEALPSVASVARVRLVTRERGSAMGTVVTAEGSALGEPSAIGAPEGTTVTVRDLFYNTPARLKYLRSVARETRRVIEAVGRLALAHPEVSFSLQVDGRNVLSTPQGGSLLEAAAAVLGVELARSMAPVNKTTQGIGVLGLAGPGDCAKSSRDVQHVLVNGRPVSCKTVWAAIDRAYDRSVPPGKKAPVVLSISVDPTSVDVNVHPAKSEVRFASESDVYSAVYAAVSAALRSMDAAPDIGSKMREGEPRGRGVELEDAASSGDSAAGARLWPSIAADRREGPAYGGGRLPNGDADYDYGDHGGRSGPVSIIGQLAGVYILAESDEGLLIIDQHVAHETVLVDTYRRQLSSDTRTQLLLSPELVQLGAGDTDLVGRHQSTLARMGFEADVFGATSVLVRGIPMAAADMAPGEALGAAVEGIAAAPPEADPESLADHIAVSLACHSAVKAGAHLHKEEMESLVAALFRCENPMRCPHGRPIVVTISRESLERSFGRR